MAKFIFPDLVLTPSTTTTTTVVITELLAQCGTSMYQHQTLHTCSSL